MKNHVLLISIGALVMLIGIGVLIGTSFTKPPFSTDTSLQIPSGAVDSVTPDATVITLTKNGFEPSEVTIKAGDTITFQSTIGPFYWPASNLHPSHLLYSEFDPQTAIQADQSWSFMFTKVGVWEFHDHIFPYYTGVIEVTE